MSTAIHSTPAQRGPVVEFDHHSPVYAQNNWRIYDELRKRTPVAWTDAHGGFWVLSRYDDIADVARDDIKFSSAENGITIPPTQQRSVPIDLDPPEAQAYRAVLQPFFSPKAVRHWTACVERWGTVCIDQVIERGRMDLIMDLANPLPALFTCEFIGLPIENWETYARCMHEGVYTGPDNPDFARTRQELEWTVKNLYELVAQERRNPREAMLGNLVRAQVNGKLLTDEEIVSICFLLMAGGFDTTTGLAGNVFNYLGENPAIRQYLIDQPDKIPNAVEEFLRYFTPQQALCRTAKQDVEIRGVRVRKGERVLLAWAAANHDPEAFEAPNEVRFDRFPNLHQAFGIGSHRCLGSHFARVEMCTMLHEVLTRLPDFTIAAGAARYPSIGIVNGWINMPATFTPGPRKLPNERLPAKA